jgi:hypothetical protein
MARTSGNLVATRISPATEKLLETIEDQKKMNRSDVLRTALDQFLFGEEWIERCNAVLNTSITQVNESHRALEARIERLVNEGAIDFEIQTLNKEIAASEERIKADLKADFELKFQAAFDKMLHKLPSIIIQLHENQKAANQQRRES